MFFSRGRGYPSQVFSVIKYEAGQEKKRLERLRAEDQKGLEGRRMNLNTAKNILTMKVLIRDKCLSWNIEIGEGLVISTYLKARYVIMIQIFWMIQRCYMVPADK